MAPWMASGSGVAGVHCASGVLRSRFHALRRKDCLPLRLWAIFLALQERLPVQERQHSLVTLRRLKMPKKPMRSQTSPQDLWPIRSRDFFRGERGRLEARPRSPPREYSSIGAADHRASAALIPLGEPASKGRSEFLKCLQPGAQQVPEGKMPPIKRRILLSRTSRSQAMNDSRRITPRRRSQFVWSLRECRRGSP